MIRWLIITMLFLTACTNRESNVIEFIDINNLPPELPECSGITYADGELFASNDSGNEPQFYSLDVETGNLLNTYEIPDVENVDWESLREQAGFWYISDTGNNKGLRDTGKMHILKKEVDQFVFVNTVEFRFPNKVAVPPNEPHDYDIEAFVFCEDQWLFFTKNRTNQKTDLQLLNHTNTDTLQYLKSLTVPARVTDACFWPERDLVILLCNAAIDDKFASYLLLLEKDESCTYNVVFETPIEIEEQAEAITHYENNEFLIGSEDETFLGLGSLYRFSINF